MGMKEVAWEQRAPLTKFAQFQKRSDMTAKEIPNSLNMKMSATVLKYITANRVCTRFSGGTEQAPRLQKAKIRAIFRIHALTLE